MKLSSHFSLEEFTASQTASRRGIDNTLPDSLLPAAQATAQMLERVRTDLGGLPIIITSGYRCSALNAAIGSSSTSDHVKAMAVDIRCPAFGCAFDVARYLAGRMDALGLGQVIYEFDSWIHCSIRTPDKVLNRILTINAAGTQAGIHRA